MPDWVRAGFATAFFDWESFYLQRGNYLGIRLVRGGALFCCARQKMRRRCVDGLAPGILFLRRRCVALSSHVWPTVPFHRAASRDKNTARRSPGEFCSTGAAARGRFGLLLLAELCEVRKPHRTNVQLLYQPGSSRICEATWHLQSNAGSVQLCRLFQP